MGTFIPDKLVHVHVLHHQHALGQDIVINFSVMVTVLEVAVVSLITSVNIPMPAAQAAVQEPLVVDPPLGAQEVHAVQVVIVTHPVALVIHLAHELRAAQEVTNIHLVVRVTPLVALAAHRAAQVAINTLLVVLGTIPMTLHNEKVKIGPLVALPVEARAVVLSPVVVKSKV